MVSKPPRYTYTYTLQYFCSDRDYTPSLLFWTRTRDSSPGTVRAFLHDVRHKLIWLALFSQVVHPFLGPTFRLKSAGGTIRLGVAKLHDVGKRTAQQLQWRQKLGIIGQKSEITRFDPQTVHCTFKNVLSTCLPISLRKHFRFLFQTPTSTMI